MIRKILAAALFASIVTVSPSFADAPPQAPVATASTFHCLSLYWTPEGGAKEKQVLVKFREAGTEKWREGLAMKYNPINTRWDWPKAGRRMPPNMANDYRGSIVNLKPGTAYEINLTLEGTDITTSLKASTWSEEFPIAETIKVPSGNATFAITKSGTPNGYILYDGTGSTIDTNNQSNDGITVNAEYVIIRGVTIKNVKSNGIHLEKGHHIVIENCDISKWGSEHIPGRGYGVEMNSAVYSRRNFDLHAVVIQRNKFHHPTWNSNSWAEDYLPDKVSKHPSGPQTITFWEPEGNVVIRYNELWSDANHYYNDIIGGAFNGSYRGWPGCDSDIYCNYIANCWDDGIEVEGGGQNVRIWNNFIEDTMVPIANAATSVGPLYVWQNVSGRSYTKPGSVFNMTHGPFMKMGYADSENWMTGHMYIFNNTIFQEKDDGADALGASSRIIKHCVTRNNIFHTRTTDTRSISTDRRSANNDFDHDLYNARVPEGAETNGIKGTPKYVEGAGFNFETKTGNFQLAPDSLGYRKGVVIPNFCELNNGNPPDVGAHQSGTPAMVVGVKANYVPPVVK
ncbi:MAG: right-handed parallel beta-helix repeat-containing protein [Phycisphaerales bacterium]|nr:right-handed parallel beta-helix repeat-containing protein [Phycisphaerales bacterium]